MAFTNNPFHRSRSRVNGATQTFRRPSLATTPSQSHMQQRESANNDGVYIPPHLNVNSTSRQTPSNDTRYGKDQMLRIYEALRESSAIDRNLEQIFLGGWDPLENKNSAIIQGGKDQVLGPEVCWNYNSPSEPLGLMQMTEEEKQVSRTSIQGNPVAWLTCGSFLQPQLTRRSSCNRPARRKVRDLVL